MFFLSDDPLFSDEELLLMGAASGGKTVEDTATGNPLTFVTDLARPLKSLLIPFTPQQSGTGDPSPTNVRNIVPWNGLKVYQSGADTSNPTDTDIVFPSPVYGGTLDVVSGVLTVEWAGFTAKWKDGTDPGHLGNNTRKKFVMPVLFVSASSIPSAYCDIAKWRWDFESDKIHFYSNGNASYVFLPNDTDGETEINIVGKLATPQEIQLTPHQITALVGDNAIWSDADGQMTAVYFKKG